MLLCTYCGHTYICYYIAAIHTYIHTYGGHTYIHTYIHIVAIHTYTVHTHTHIHTYIWSPYIHTYILLPYKVKPLIIIIMFTFCVRPKLKSRSDNCGLDTVPCVPHAHPWCTCPSCVSSALPIGSNLSSGLNMSVSVGLDCLHYQAKSFWSSVSNTHFVLSRTSPAKASSLLVEAHISIYFYCIFIGSTNNAFLGCPIGTNNAFFFTKPHRSLSFHGCYVS